MYEAIFKLVIKQNNNCNNNYNNNNSLYFQRVTHFAKYRLIFHETLNMSIAHSEFLLEVINGYRRMAENGFAPPP